MTYQTIKTPSGETLIVLTEEEFEDLRDAADLATARAKTTELLTMEETMALVDAPTPLHFWRRKRDLTQAQLAKLVGISQNYIANLESGARKGDPSLYKKLAAVLRVPMEDLVQD